MRWDSPEMVNKEDQDQVALASYLDLLTSPAGDGRLFWFHPPNGGFRNKRTAANMKAQGTKKGIPDVCIEEVPPNFPDKKGVRLELKRSSKSKSRVSKEQMEVLKRYELRGFKVYVCYGLDEAIAAIKACGFA